MVERKYWDPEIETAPPEINRRRQTEKLKALVKRVYDNTVFYRRRFDEAGIKPEDIQTLEDLQRIPLIEVPVRPSEVRYAGLSRHPGSGQSNGIT